MNSGDLYENQIEDFTGGPGINLYQVIPDWFLIWVTVILTILVLAIVYYLYKKTKPPSV